MSNRKHHKLTWTNSEKILIGFFLIAIVSFAFYRSYKLDITNDEAYSFINVDTLNLELMIRTANTHWLNSLFMLIENLIDGKLEWSLRLHSVLSIIIFAYFILKNFKHDYKSVLILIPLTLLTCNHYLFDFFSLARGYALALTFELLAFYNIVQHRKHITRIYLFLGLATISNFTCIYILFSYSILDVLGFIRTKRMNEIFKLKFFVERWPLLLATLFSIPIIFYIKFYTGDLEEGLTNGFVRDTLLHFFQQTFYHINTTLLYWSLVVWTLGLLVFYLYKFESIRTGYRRLFEIFFLNIFLIHVLFYGAKVPFPYGRTSFFLIILFLFLSAYVIIELVKMMPDLFHWIIPILFFVLNLSYVFMYRNLNVTMEWWMQQGLKKFCVDFRSMNLDNVETTKLGMSIDHFGSFDNYYRYLNKSKLPDSIFVYSRQDYKKMSEALASQFEKQDYLLMINDYEPFLNNKIPIKNQEVLKEYPDMKSVFIKVEK